MRVVPSPGAARSFWLQEALTAEESEPCPPLDAHVKADVCIVGGGFAGLWTAEALTASEPGLRVVLLEQDIVGGGASGRNGGFVSASWWDLPALVGFLGEEGGLDYAHRLAGAVGQIGSFVGEHGIDCWWHHEGALALRAGEWQRGVAGEEAVDLAAHLGAGERFRALGSQEVRAIADSPRARSGAFTPDSATVQPARLARGLRRVLRARGVRIHERTRMVAVDRSRPAIVRTERGAVMADHVVFATGSWAAAMPEFGTSFAVVVDTMVVTEPIPDRLEEIGWRSHVGIADGRDLLLYLRRTDDDRVAIGGGALGTAFGGRADGRAVTHDRHAADVAARGLLWLFPQLEGVRFTHAWGGPIDQTASSLPFYRTLPPGNLHAALGFSGHGLTQTWVAGRILAGRVLGQENGWTMHPAARHLPGLAPPEPFRWPLVKLAAWALERGDAREQSERPRGAVLGAIGQAPERYREYLMRRAQ